MMEVKATSCCGMAELNRICIAPRDVVKRVANLRPKLPIVVFTDITDRYGGRLADYIEKRKLGTVIVTAPRYNPNSGNQIQAWLWTPDYAAIAVFLRGNKINAKR